MQSAAAKTAQPHDLFTKGSSPAQFVLVITHSFSECNAVQRDYFTVYAMMQQLSTIF
jgi:hypothetical protein